MYQTAPDQLSPELRARYDIIGMDPRGVGKSTPVRCMSARQATRLLHQQKNLTKAAEANAKVCGQKSGHLLPFVGTDNVARDLDVVRAVLDDDKLNYLGFSYGTVIGQFYAQLHPRRVGRMVLDSVVNPALWPADAAGQAVAFETALGVFVQSCIDRGNCPMGPRRGEAIEKIDALVERVRAKPLATGTRGEPPLTSSALLQILSGAMYREDTWPALAKALAAAFDDDIAPLAAFAGNSRGDGDDDPDNDETGGPSAVRCLHLRPEQRTPEALDNAIAEAGQDAPIFGESAEDDRVCAVWPAPSMPWAGRAMTAAGAPEILLVNNRYDASTPISWARSVDGQLASATLVTNTSGGHIFYPKGPCTRQVVDDYLLRGKTPPKNKTCHDRAPGITPPARDGERPST